MGVEWRVAGYGVCAVAILEREVVLKRVTCRPRLTVRCVMAICKNWLVRRTVLGAQR